MNTNRRSYNNTNSITDENPIITGSRNNTGITATLLSATDIHVNEIAVVAASTTTSGDCVVMMEVTESYHNNGDNGSMSDKVEDNNNNAQITTTTTTTTGGVVLAAAANRVHSSPPPMFFVEKDTSAAVAFQVQVDSSCGEGGSAVMMTTEEGTDAIAEVSVIFEGEGEGGGGGGGGNAVGGNNSSAGAMSSGVVGDPATTAATGSNSTANNTPTSTSGTTGLSTTEAYNGDTSTIVTTTTDVVTNRKRSSEEAFSISSESVTGTIPANSSFVAGTTATVPINNNNNNNGSDNNNYNYNGNGNNDGSSTHIVMENPPASLPPSSEGASFPLPVSTILLVPPLVALTSTQPLQQEEEHQHLHHLLLQQNPPEDETHMFEPAASVSASVSASVLPNDNNANKKRKTMTNNGTTIAKNSVNNEQWDAMYDRLKSYKQRNGDCLVPKRYAADPKLGTWVETQRVQYRKLPRCDIVIGTNNNNDTANGATVTTDATTTINSPGNEFGVTPNKRLTAERLRKLTSIGFIWSAKHVRKNHNGNNKNSPSSNNNNNNNNATEMVAQVQGLQATTTAMNSYMTNSPPNFPFRSDVHDSVANFTTNAAFAAAPGHIIIDTSLTMTEPTMMMMMMTTTGETNVPQSLSLMQTQQMEFQVLQDHLQAGRHSQNYPLQQQYYPQQRRHRLNEAQWDDMYQRLVQYKIEFGDCLVPRKYEKDSKLSRWVETQRVLWNRDNNNNNRKQIQHNDNFNEAAATMMAISNNPVLTGTSSPEGFATTSPIDPSVSIELAGNDPEINTDLPELMATIDDTKAKRLTPERKLKLDNLGFVWSLRSKRIEDHWDEMFKQLLAYKEHHGDCLVPSRYEENLKLGKWVETQRYEYTKLQRALTTTTAAKQDEMQFSMNSDDGDSSKASDDIDNSAVVGDNSATAIATSTKSTTTGSRPHNPRLTEGRLHRLESIGFQWKVKNKMKRFYDKQWDNMFEKLNAFKMDNGHCMVPKRYPADIKLGTWVHTQRIQFRKLTAGTKKEALTEEEVTALKSCGDEINYRLTEERRLRLEGIGFVWSAREGEKAGDKGRTTRNSYDDQWDNMVVQLKQYQEKNGNCLVPKRYKDNPKLGTWVDTQRVQYKKLQKMLAEQGKAENVRPGEEEEKNIELSATSDNSKVSPQKPLVGRLTDNRIQRLEQLGFVWTLRDDWQKHYEELKAYKAQYDNCNVPARYTTNRRLGIWVSAQRQQFKAMNQQKLDPKSRKSAPLTQERIKLLNDIGFTWTIRSRDSLGESWNARLIELKTFKAKYGHCLVPSRYAECPELGIWVGTQRTQFRLYVKSKESGTADVSGSIAMSEQRIHELEALDFVWALRSASKEGSATTVTATGTTSV